MSSFADQPVPDTGRDSTISARVEELYGSHVGLVRSVCRSLLRDPVEAQDAVQQTFLSAHRALLNGAAPREAAAWLATIARNECLARIRARMRDPLPVEVEEQGAAAPDAHAVAVRRHDAGELRDALAQLPTQQREAILLREVRGFSYQEVASALSVTTSAAESLLFRSRRSLRVQLREALAALSPGAWAQPLCDLGAHIAGGGLAAPAAAKVAAVGVGAAVMTGGAFVEPTVLGLGHAPARSVKTTHAAVQRSSSTVSPQVFALPRAASAAPTVLDVAEHSRQPAERVVDDRSAASPDRHEGSQTTERERRDAASTTSGDGSSSFTAARRSGDGTQQYATSDSTRLRTDASGDSSTDSAGSSSDTTTTSSSGFDD